MDNGFCYGIVLCFSLGVVAFITYDVCVLDQSILQLHGESLTSCAERCNCLSNCQYIRYHGLMMICEVFDKQPEIRDKKCPGYSMISKTNSTKALKLGNTHNCSLNHTAVCPLLKHSDPNTMSLGNTNNIGSKRVITCSDTYEVDGKHTTECASTGQWSEHGVCRKVCKGSELTDANAVVTEVKINTSEGTLVFDSISNVVTPLFDGTTATLVCNRGTQIKDPVTTTCVNGSWSQFPTCGSLMREPCETDSDCVDANSECRNGTCWCQPGLSYDACQLACVGACPSMYGNTFQMWHNYIPNSDRTFYEKVPTNDVQACKLFCIGDTNMENVCNAVHFVPSTQQCYLYRNTSSGARLNQLDFDYVYLKRDCITCAP